MRTLTIEPQRTQEATHHTAVCKGVEDTRAMTEDSIENAKIGRETDPATKKWIRCDSAHCGQPAVGLLALRFYCLGHFISHCYERLDRCSSNPLNDPDVVTTVSVDRFLQQCITQAGELVRPIRGFDNLDRARLFDIFLWASDLVAKRSLFKNGFETTSENSFDSSEESSNCQYKKAGAE
jgi:hypothetical protein